MKFSTNNFAAAILTLALSGSQLFAESSSVATLSDSEWDAIEESADLDNMLAIDALPAFKAISVKALEMDFVSGNSTNLILDAPFNRDEQIGVVVFDNEGELVHTASGSFEDLRELKFSDYFDWDMTYIVKMYSETAVYETKVQVVYR